jgi:hypothetical protein
MPAPRFIDITNVRILFGLVNLHFGAEIVR